MKFTLGWLKTHLETDADLAAVADALTAIGLEVEALADRAAGLDPFTVAEVLDARPHPNADRLRVCTVATGAGTVEVVCGAPNARAGIKAVFAASGTTIPRTGVVLKAADIRGVASNGMLCSAYEMGLSDEHDGIIELPDDAAVGQPFAGALGLDDPVIDIAVTPNRADCLGVRGIARDLAARGLGTLRPVTRDRVVGSFITPISVTIAADAEAGCPFFVARLIRGVRNGDSPAWLQRRLRAIGLRPISALVDITNFLTYDINRPLHVFDAAKLSGDLTVRAAVAGETLAALNGKSYPLDAGMIVIADDSGLVSLGGVIGGAGTGCDGGTVDVLVEAAYFDPLRTARTGRALAIHSDARHRFERGVDPAGVVDGIVAATRMIIDHCGGAAGTIVIAGSEPPTRRTIGFRPSRPETLGGVAVTVERSRAILTALGCTVEQAGAGVDGTLTVVPPSWRADLDGEADLVEEVLRIHGYDAIPATPLPPLSTMPGRAVTVQWRRTGVVRRVLAARGMMEAVSFSFLDGDAAARFGATNPALRLANPIAADLGHMRPSPLPNLIAAAGRNAARGADGGALFEIGPGFRDPTPEGQVTILCGVRFGTATAPHWRHGATPVDAFDAKADLMAAIEALGISAGGLATRSEAPSAYHPGQSGTITLGPKLVLGHFGALHPLVLADYGLDLACVGFELFVDAVPLPRARAGHGRALLKLPAFQPITRDFAFVLDRSVAAETVLRAASGADKTLLAGVALFDLYEGDRLPAGKKSLAIRATLQPLDRTPTDAEIEAVGAALVAAVGAATGAVLR